MGLNRAHLKPSAPTALLLAHLVVLASALVAAGAGQPEPPAAQPRPEAVPRATATAAEVPAAPLPPHHRPEAFGAVGDGETDDTAALQQAFDALAPGETLLLAPGRVYLHSRVLRMTRPGTRLAGPGALLAGDEERSSLQLRADDLRVEDVQLWITATTRRWTAPDQHRLVLGRHAGLQVAGVSVVGAAGAGIYVEGASGFTLTDVTVSQTRADGIHMTGGAQDGEVLRPVLRSTGDDGVAVVSYTDDPAVSRRIEITSPRVHRTTGGRGVSVVGGEDIVYRDVQVDGSSSAGIYLATEGAPFFTRSTQRVQVLGATVRNANTDAAVDHGAVVVAAAHAGTSVREVLITDLAVSGTRSGASRQVGVLSYGAPVEDVELRDVRISGGGRAYQSTAARSAVRLLSWTVDGVRVPEGQEPG